VEILQRYPDYKMRISGHTDSVGSAASNQELSERRAKACYDYLVAKGIDPERLSYEGFGESQPIADNRYREGREQNRRVEFDIYLDEN
jgi:outer membrane protein OmpA-like peptidoglycan-associated protein